MSDLRYVLFSGLLFLGNGVNYGLDRAATRAKLEEKISDGTCTRGLFVAGSSRKESFSCTECGFRVRNPLIMAGHYTRNLCVGLKQSAIGAK